MKLSDVRKELLALADDLWARKQIRAAKRLYALVEHLHR